VGLLIRGPLSAGELLDLAFAVAKRNLLPLLGLGGLPLAVAVLLDYALRVAGVDAGGFELFIITMAMSGIAESRMVVGAWQLLHQQPIDPVDARGRVRRRLLSVILGYLLKWVLVVIGLAFLLVPGILALLWWFAVPTVTVLEDRGVRDSLRRSRSLARGHMRRLVGTVGVFDLALMALSLGIAFLYADAASGELPLWAEMANWLLAALLYPIRSSLVAAVYTEIRVREEAYDLEAAASELTRTA
jgi:uncharacterized membrane protein YhdT